MLNATWGPHGASVGRIFRRGLVTFVTLTTFILPHAAHPAATDAQNDTPAGTGAPLVALASSFRSIWPVLMAAYLTEHNGHPPSASFGSSGLLSTQILRGAPFELFLSADQRSVSRLTASGKTPAEPFALATGTLSLVTRPPGAAALATTSATTTEANSAKAALTMGAVKALMAEQSSVKIAIPNPRHAPYGIAAQQALEAAGLWPIPRGALLQAENASQALQYVLSGAATFALVPTTLVSDTAFTIDSTTLAPNSYDAVVHHLAILTPAGDGARELEAWLRTPRALNIMMQFGLSAP